MEGFHREMGFKLRPGVGGPSWGGGEGREYNFGRKSSKGKDIET